MNSLLMPFRGQPPSPRLRDGYRLLHDPAPNCDDLNRLLHSAGEPPRPSERWALVLERSSWSLAISDRQERWVGFLRATSDRALNANLWDLLSDPADAARQEVIAVLVHTALLRLRRELAGCSVSISAAPETLEALRASGFVIDPGGIRAMGLRLQPPT
ncbi:MAG: N-acetyltransferase [Synechococcaceae cyanobacterium]|nr:N-acetyltransferase [Synechococcaceae cyanobacterium]